MVSTFSRLVTVEYISSNLGSRGFVILPNMYLVLFVVQILLKKDYGIPPIKVGYVAYMEFFGAYNRTL